MHRPCEILRRVPLHNVCLTETKGPKALSQLARGLDRVVHCSDMRKGPVKVTECE